MTACAEDLGVNLKVMPEVLKELNILSLKVIRWTREWDKESQPYLSFNSYPELSVATTSVHDSSTLRQWWNEEKQSVEQFINAAKEAGVSFEEGEAYKEFTATSAEKVLTACSASKSAYLITPLQDYLYLNQKYYLENSQDERINVPGSVNNFNWTYRIPVSIEELSKDEELINKIKTLVEKHNR